MSDNIQKKYVRARVMAAMIGCGLSTLWKMARDERIPKPIRMGNRLTLWDVDKVLNCIGHGKEA